MATNETKVTNTTETQVTTKKKRNLSENTQKLNAITFEYMIDYIDKKAPKDRDWFVDVAFENEKYKHFKARNAFVERYMPELCSVKKSKWEILKAKKWVK